MNSVEIQQVHAAEIIDLRWRVLRAGLPRETAMFDGDEQASSLHLAAVTGGRIVGCTTLLPSRWEDQPAWQLRGMAVDPEFYGRGIGRKLLTEIDRFISGSEIQILWCNARLAAVPFYERCGWQKVSELFEVPTAGPHYRMRRNNL